MVKDLKTGYVSPFAIHPGETIKEALDFIGMSQKDLSDRSGISEKTISLIISGEHPISPESALKFERVLGLSQKMLLQMYADYEADLFRLNEKKKLAKETDLLTKYTCYNELAEFGYVKKTKDIFIKIEDLLKFFGVNSLSLVPVVMATDDISFRKNTKRKINTQSLFAWLRMGYLQAQVQKTANFDKDILEKNIEIMRTLTKLHAKDFSKKLIDLCAEAGVALVYTPHLKNTYVNGSARWVSPDKPLIQLSLYQKHEDIFWFSLFHELAHILKHSKKKTFVEFETVTIIPDAVEREADIFAQQQLIPKDKEEQFLQLKGGLNRINYSEQIQDFAEQINIDPGIIAGRIARETGAWRYMARLRRRMTFSAT